MEEIMIFKVEKRRSRQGEKLKITRCYYLRYRIGDMPVDKWKSLGVTDFAVANKKAQDFIREEEREAAGIIEPKLARDAAQKALREHLNDYEADLLTRGRAGCASVKVSNRPSHGCSGLETGGASHRRLIHPLAQ
jgi:hypothetical protein